MKQFILFLSGSLFIFSACHQQRPGLNSDDEKTIYAIGNDWGMRLKTLQLSEKEKNILKMGIDDGVSGKKPQVEPRKFMSKVGDMIRTRQEALAGNEKKEGKKFLEEAEKKEKAEKTKSGLIYVNVKEGSGENPKSSDRVKVNYHGTLRNGEVFDSTRNEGRQPAIFRLDRVIKCWQEGVQKMKAGGKAELYCPSDLAYGDRGAPPKILPGSVLKFEVELLEIVKEGDEKPQEKPADNPKENHKEHKHKETAKDEAAKTGKKEEKTKSDSKSETKPDQQKDKKSDSEKKEKTENQKQSDKKEADKK